jgi:hypothetical protein
MAINWDQPQPASRALWSVVHANFPQARNLGIYNPRNVAGTNTPSAHAEGRALDIGLLVSRPNEKLIGDQLFKIFIETSDELGLDHVIWNRQIWSQAHPSLRPYHGQNPHTNHVHVAFTREGSQGTSFPRTNLEIAILRTGLEDLSRAHGNLA